MNPLERLYLHLSTIVYTWRLNGVSRISCSINIFCLVLVYLVIPLESSVYSHLRKNFHYYYPQIKKNHPKPLDPLRVLIQTVFLIFIRQRHSDEGNMARLIAAVTAIGKRFIIAPAMKLASFSTAKLHDQIGQSDGILLPKSRKKLSLLFLFVSFCASIVAISQPLDVTYQFIFVGLMWITAVFLKSVKNRVSLMLLIVISIIIACRYIFWRVHTTIILVDAFTSFCAITLLLAELYTFVVLLLSYFQVSWVLERKPYPLPEDQSLWPSVDIFIPSYNEPLDVVEPCLLAALDIDWPEDKLHVYMLDDGSRPEFESFCKSIGVGYIKRTEHNHAKAGNINHALTLTNGELIAIFDCDHVPTRAFLQMTVGWMVHDRKIALVQTPHHFYSDDPFEKNLSLKGRIPSENALFHDFIQKGNDTWNATMFCGSCAVIRRGPLEEIGGIAVETVTEDAHTSLRLNRRGYSSAFISMPLAAGLATESLADHINQRIRWARGMVQIFRVDNPLLGKGLTLAQRLCFTNAMIHFFHGLPRIIFLLAPLPYLFFNVYVIFATGLAILSYVFPYMLHTTLTNQRIQGNKRFYFWGVVYETILSWYITVPTLMALIAPKIGKFNVTSKGSSNTRDYFDWTVTRPYIFLIFLNFAGLIYGIYKIIFDPFAEVSTILINLGWVSYNLLVLGAAAAVALETRQVRTAPRVPCSMDAILESEDGYTLDVIVRDFSRKGLGIELPKLEAERRSLSDLFHTGEELYINLRKDGINYRFKISVKFCAKNHLGVIVLFEDKKQKIEFIRCTFACADRWTHSFDNLTQDSLIHGIHTLVVFGLNGYLKMLKNSPHVFREILWVIIKCLMFGFSILPQPLDMSIKKLPHENKVHR